MACVNLSPSKAVAASSWSQYDVLMVQTAVQRALECGLGSLVDKAMTPHTPILTCLGQVRRFGPGHVVSTRKSPHPLGFGFPL